MKTLLLFFIILFLPACQSADNTPQTSHRVIMQLKQPLAEPPGAFLEQLRRQSGLKSIILIRQNTPGQLLVLVRDNRKQQQWLSQLNRNPLVDYAEIDYKKHF